MIRMKKLWILLSFSLLSCTINKFLNHRRSLRQDERQGGFEGGAGVDRPRHTGL